MKTRKPKSSMDNQLFNAFKDVCADDETINEAVSDAKKAFSYIMNHDAVFRKGFSRDEP